MQIEPENASALAPSADHTNNRSRGGSRPHGLDQARRYLAKVVPWSQEGEPPSYINIHYTVKAAGYDKPAWRGTPCRSVNEAIKQIDWVLKQPDARDVYVCMSSQRQALEKTSAKTGKTFKAALRSQDNAIALKSLFLDVDAKDYADLGEAVAELGRFLRETNLPKPSVIVKSGGGLHVYFTLARALTVEEWRPLAHALVEATKQHGLKVDAGCTTDSARVLRVPQTLNRKLDTPRPVTLVGGRTGLDDTVERIQQALEPYRVALPSKVTLPALFEDPSLFPVKPRVEDKAGDLTLGIVTAMSQVDVELDGAADLRRYRGCRLWPHRVATLVGQAPQSERQGRRLRRAVGDVPP